MTKCCNTCTHYHWYYDHCDKWDCEVDDRSVCAQWRDKMRLIDPIELKRSIAVSNIIGDGKTLEELIDEQPDAQPEPKRGNWLMRDGRVICSRCENVPYNKIEYDGAVVYHIPKIAEVMKYCPICGARMS